MRDYAKEYANYHSDPEQIKRRTARNAARRAMRGRKDLTDEKDVHHKDNNPMNNDKSNLSIVTQHYNRREPRLRMEDLRKWFGKGKKGDWVRVGADGDIKGDCAREPGEGKPKCMPRDKAHSMKKKDRASSARRKRRADPEVDRPGTGNKPIMVKTDKKESVEMQEKTNWKMGDGRPRNGASIENDRFWNLPKAQLMYIRKDAHDAMKANPTGKKAGKYADEVNDAATVLAWRKKNGIRESVKLDEAKELTYTVVHARKGKVVVTAPTSYDAAKKAAKQWKLKSTAGVDAYLMKESVELDEAMGKLNAKGEIEMTAKNYAKVHKDYKTKMKGVPYAMQIDPKTGGSALYPVKIIKESVDLEEKNVPTNPALWSKFKSQAKAKFDVYPSAYANGWASKQYKAAGGSWKTESVQEMMTFSQMREAVQDWKVTVTKPVNKLKKGASQSVKARSAFEAINKAIKLWGDPALKAAPTSSFKITKESVDEVKKPVSQMTPAEKAANDKRRKEYNAHQKSKGYK